MIGDWVYCDGKNYQIAEIGGMVCLDAENELFGSLEDISPIPLTPEILEKNGFVMSKMRSWQLREGSLYACWKRQWLNLFVGVAPIANTHTKCEFVHELQHALKLFGIDKEIEL